VEHMPPEAESKWDRRQYNQSRTAGRLHPEIAPSARGGEKDCCATCSDHETELAAASVCRPAVLGAGIAAARGDCGGGICSGWGTYRAFSPAGTA
jgi:hypothetical protein